MEVRDYNGEGKWSLESVTRRHREYCGRFGLSNVTDFVARTHVEGDVTWIYPILDDAIAGAERGDRACIEIALELIEEERHLPFGKILKSNAARALRRAGLTDEQRERARRRIVNMLVRGMVPHEFREYAKLLRSLGPGSWWPFIESGIPRGNPYAMRYFRYFLSHWFSRAEKLRSGPGGSAEK